MGSGPSVFFCFDPRPLILNSSELFTLTAHPLPSSCVRPRVDTVYIIYPPPPAFIPPSPSSPFSPLSLHLHPSSPTLPPHHPVPFSVCPVTLCACMSSSLCCGICNIALYLLECRIHWIPCWIRLSHKSASHRLGTIWKCKGVYEDRQPDQEGLCDER